MSPSVLPAAGEHRASGHECGRKRFFKTDFAPHRPGRECAGTHAQGGPPRHLRRAGACSAAASNLIGARYGRAQRKHFHQIERARETVCLLCALRGGVGERGCMHQGAVGSPTIAAAVFCYTLGAGFGAELGFACSVGLVVLLFLARELTAGKVDAGACQ